MLTADETGRDDETDLFDGTVPALLNAFFYEVIIAGWEQCISSLGAEFYILNTIIWSCSQKCFRLDEISTRIQMERADQKFWCAVVITLWEMFWCPCMLVKRGPLEKHTDHIATMFESRDPSINGGNTFGLEFWFEISDRPISGWRQFNNEIEPFVTQRWPNYMYSFD